MKYFLRYVVLIFILFLSSGVASLAQNAWFSNPSIPASATSGHYRTFSFNWSAFTASSALGYLQKNTSAATISIPKPDGEMISFQLQKTDVLAPEVRMPEGVYTYSGQSPDGLATIRLTLYQGKVWGIAMQAGYTWYINSATSNPSLVEFFDDNGRVDQARIPRCNADDLPLNISQSAFLRNANSLARNVSVSCILKTYRLALAGTADYTNYFGSRTAAFVNTVAIVNNLNAIYERDLTVHLTLVTDSTLMYTNAAADPFNNTNADPCSEISISQSNFTSAVGNANYDLGMTLYGQNIGGCAYVGVVCNNTYKGGGAGGYTSPTPTSYLLQVCAHEIGHEFSAGHTHNANDGTCTPTLTSSWEPGGGSTIMAYGTACAVSYPFNNSQLYFHGGSLGQMRAYTTSSSGACYAGNNLGNTTPAITTPTDDTFFVPIHTPFKLEAIASDQQDTNSLTYTFEEMDLGTGSALPPSDTTVRNPIIRSFEPSPISFRYIPKMDSILQNIYPAFESLPSIQRKIQFWATVRDNHSGCGCVSVDTIYVSTRGTTPFAVTSQGTASTASSNSNITITWNVAGTTASPFNVANVKILFAANGYDYTYVLKASTANDGTEQVTLPNVATTTGRIMVAAVGNVFFDINNANITVQPACTTVQNSAIYPDKTLIAAVGQNSLQLSEAPLFGTATDTITGLINAASPAGSIAIRASATDSSCATSYSGHYQVFRFRVGVAGSYAVSHTNYSLGTVNFFTLYSSGGFVPGSICTNYLYRSNANLNASSISYGSDFTFTGAADSVYYVVFEDYGSSATYGNYRLNIIGPGKVYLDDQLTGSSYAYVVVNGSNNNIVSITATPPDLRTTANGTYYIYGLSYTTGMNLNSYVGQPFSTLQYGTFSASNCVALSANARQIVIGGGTPLAIKNVQLAATTAGENILLKWSLTDDEDKQNNGFVIERSSDASDFKSIASLNKEDNKLSAANFSYTDVKPQPGINYYRVKSVETSGDYLYSNIAKATVRGASGFSLAPNPTSGLVTIRSFAPSPDYALSVTDIYGRLVRTVHITTASYTVDLTGLTTGAYFLRGDGSVFKLIKQ